MAQRGGRDNGNISTGQQVATGLGILGAIGLAGYALYKAFQEASEENAPAPTQRGQRQLLGDSGSYNSNKCVLCDEQIFSKATSIKLYCDHVIHRDCLVGLVDYGCTKCPKCKAKLGNKAVIDNRSRSLNPKHPRSGPGRPAGYRGKGDKADLDNRSDLLNPTNPKFKGDPKKGYYGFRPSRTSFED